MRQTVTVQMTGYVRVTLVGDWPLVRSGFRQLLQSAGVGVIASVAEAADAANVLRRLGSDAVVVSALTCESGVTNTRTLLALDPNVRVLVLGRCADADAVRQSFEAGARGYLVLEQATDADLIHAVRRVVAGELYVSPGVSVCPRSASPPELDTGYARLTHRERQVLMLVASGCSTREIAARLGLSFHTVAVHRTRIMKTLAVRKTTALVLVAVRHGLVTAD